MHMLSNLDIVQVAKREERRRCMRALHSHQQYSPAPKQLGPPCVTSWMTRDATSVERHLKDEESTFQCQTHSQRCNSKSQLCRITLHIHAI